MCSDWGSLWWKEKNERYGERSDEHAKPSIIANPASETRTAVMPGNRGVKGAREGSAEESRRERLPLLRRCATGKGRKMGAT